MSSSARVGVMVKNKKPASWFFSSEVIPVDHRFILLFKRNILTICSLFWVVVLASALSSPSSLDGCGETPLSQQRISLNWSKSAANRISTKCRKCFSQNIVCHFCFNIGKCKYPQNTTTTNNNEGWVSVAAATAGQKVMRNSCVMAVGVNVLIRLHRLHQCSDGYDTGWWQ